MLKLSEILRESYGLSVLFSKNLLIKLSHVQETWHSAYNSTTFKLSFLTNDNGVFECFRFQESAEFSWGESTRSSLLSAYFYGYLVLQVPGGWLAGRYGATRVISLAMTLSAICTLLIPLAARNSLPLFYALRVATGLFAVNMDFKKYRSF